MSADRKSAFTIAGRMRSVACALRGILTVLGSQHNAWVHLVATGLVCAMAFWLRLGSAEWCWLILAMVGVWTAEGLNTALEILADVVSPEQHPLIGKAKDVAAGVVLIAAAGSMLIGLLVFGPHVLELLRK